MAFIYENGALTLLCRSVRSRVCDRCHRICCWAVVKRERLALFAHCFNLVITKVCLRVVNLGFTLVVRHIVQLLARAIRRIDTRLGGKN